MGSEAQQEVASILESYFVRDDLAEAFDQYVDGMMQDEIVRRSSGDNVLAEIRSHFRREDKLRALELVRARFADIHKKAKQSGKFA